MICFQKYLSTLLIFFSAQLSAQDLIHTTINYTTEQGLAGNEVVKVIQDRHGFIWAATHNGLSKFDGYGFKNYTFNPTDTTSLRSIWITDLALDISAILWISTEWGINSAVTSARLTAGGVWTNASDKNIKTNISILSGKDVLNKITALPITRWSYKAEGDSITHIGPMAQDFYALFKTGQDDKTISTIDPAGVALIGVQQLKIENDILKIELVNLQKQMDELRKMMTK